MSSDKSSRIEKGTAQNMSAPAKIGGELKLTANAPFLQERLNLFNEFYQAHLKTISEKPQQDIEIILPDGSIKKGIAWKTTPMMIAEGIAKGLALAVCVAKVEYLSGEAGSQIVDVDEDESGCECCHDKEQSAGQLWDLNRVLEGSCKLTLLKFDDKEAKGVFWHSSAHVLGQASENLFGVHLCMGPALDDGFYYDSYTGGVGFTDVEVEKLSEECNRLIKEKQTFERCIVTKAQALQLFAHNPFKVSIIQNKVGENDLTSVYRCGTLIDLCRGPHLPEVNRIKGFTLIKSSSCYWLGNAQNDSLQRVYGISFPTPKELTEWKKFQEEAKANDHRRLGEQQELFFFHELSPGSCFFLPKGAHIYNKLVSFIRGEYVKRNYTEVVSPNVFNLDLWRISGHYDHYVENMFVFKCDDAEYGLKPMNCPGHCLMFKHTMRSYRELPLRFADFGVLHRNELSGALNGLTRVRRFQQDDAHIFCRHDQIKQEVHGVIDFIKAVYGVFGMSFKLELSTRPAKAMGDLSLWENAETSLRESLDEIVGAGNWKVNPGDGAFYGPKIDIKVLDAMNRVHQTATVQLDFQLPIRFDLWYKGQSGDFERPVMVHRAILGSVERCFAILLEHYKGKWPFWLSPRQAMIIPVNETCQEYALKLQEQLKLKEYMVDIDLSGRTLNKMVREAQISQYNYMLVVGNKEMESNSVSIRARTNDIVGVKSVEELMQFFSKLSEDHE